MSYTKGPWRIGARCNSVVSDDSSGISIGGATGDDAVEYYGGNLIAESISECNLSIIAAATDLYEALKEITKAERISPELWNQIHCALLKAEGK